MNEKDLDSRVKESNKKFYNAVADIYEAIDGRRTKALEQWLELQLESLSKGTAGKVLLDLGCGTGVVLRNSGKFFRYSYGIDISVGILKKMKRSGGICADCSFIPFNDESVDVVSCFSVLHHMYSHESVFKEVYRILKKGGLFYIDHDIDTAFVNRFYPFISIYRHIFNPARKYMQLKNGITEELYNLSEIHSKGIDAKAALNSLRNLGFSEVETYYHWFGLNGFINKIMGHHKFKRGDAPLTHIVVKKY